ncbi:MAG: 2-oxo acid dehydrogenase subunit E2 [Solirubrobacterales bacterium]|nr:2-oxo acid dehydrogenase subunit E2 [Solirubrobacterales bacterium]
MPRLSDSMEEGVILSWLVTEGQEVAPGDDLVEIETDKANMTFEADGAGLVHIVAREGDSLPVGAPIAQLLSPGEEPEAEGAPSQSAPEPEAEAEPAPKAEPEPEPERREPEPGRRVKASPLARRLAAANGVDLAALTGSGPGGRIVKADVLAAKAAPAEPAEDKRTPEPGGKGTVTTVEINRLQTTIARRMAESKATIPHFYLSTEIDMGRCAEARARIKETLGADAPSLNDMVVKAAALALRRHPKVNGAYRDGSFELYSRANVGVAVAAEDALVVPVIADADRIGLTEIAATTRRLAAKVRDGSISPPELSGGTFTVSNLGMLGVTEFEAVINPGQAAILAVGAIVERPAVRGGELVPAKLMKATLSCDHRILYGAEGAEFLASVKAMLEEPAALAL